MFKVGDEVVCVDARPAGGSRMWSDIKAGEIYHVVMVNNTCCSMRGLIYPYGDDVPCLLCGGTDQYWHYHKWRFVKLPKQTVEHEEEALA